MYFSYSLYIEVDSSSTWVRYRVRLVCTWAAADNAVVLLLIVVWLEWALNCRSSPLTLGPQKVSLCVWNLFSSMKSIYMHYLCQVNRNKNASQQTTQDNETLFPNWQKESWQTAEETCRYVRPECVNKWPDSMTDIWWWWHMPSMCQEVVMLNVLRMIMCAINRVQNTGKISHEWLNARQKESVQILLLFLDEARCTLRRNLNS